MNWPKRPESFDDVLDLVLLAHFDPQLCSPGFVESVYAANPEGYGTTREERDALFPLLITFALKERAER